MPGRQLQTPEETVARRLLLWIAIAVGVALRILCWFRRGDFWGDEAALAFNIATRSLGELAGPLALDQAAPFGYLALLAGVGAASGMDEMVLRLPSLAASLITLPLVAWGLRAAWGRRAALVGTILVALSPDLIHFAGELKPYAGDAALAAGCLAFTGALRTPPGRSAMLWLAVGGILAVWFSFPIIFVLGGCALSLGVRALWLRDRRAGLMWLGLGALWAASFALTVLLTQRAAAGNRVLHEYWAAGFPAEPAWTPQGLRWLVGHAAYLFESPFGLSSRSVASVFYLAGCVSIARRRPVWLGLNLVPIGLLFAAAYLGRYPVEGRLALFAVPLLAAPLAVALADACDSPRRTRQMLGAFALVGLLWVPLQRDLREPERADSGPGAHAVVEALADTDAAEDTLAISWESTWVYAYYAQRVGFRPARALALERVSLGTEGWTRVLADLAPGARVRLLVSTFRSEQPDSELPRLTGAALGQAREISRQDFPGSGLALFEFERLAP